MFEDITIEQLNRRCATMRALSRSHTTKIIRFLSLPPEKRKIQSGFKPDGSTITTVDIANNYQLMNEWAGEYPEDDINGEECGLRRYRSSPADYEIFEDPIDSTNHAISYIKDHPAVGEKWPTHLLSLTFQGEAVAFTLGVPLKDEYYFGSYMHHVQLNGNEYQPNHSGSEKIILGVAEHEQGQVTILERLTGRKTYGIAGLYVWIILQGVTAAGICPYPLPHESNCIAAAARSMGAVVTNEFGKQFQAHNRLVRAVWSFPPFDHDTILRMARERR